MRISPPSWCKFLIYCGFIFNHLIFIYVLIHQANLTLFIYWFIFIYLIYIYVLVHPADLNLFVYLLINLYSIIVLVHLAD